MAETRRDRQAEVQHLEDLAARLDERLARSSPDERWLAQRDVDQTRARLEHARHELSAASASDRGVAR